MENRTRTYQPRQDICYRPGPFKGSYECQLPAEARTELLKEIPPPQYRPTKPRVRVRAVGRKLEEIPPPQTPRLDRGVSQVPEPYRLPTLPPREVFLRPPPPVSREIPTHHPAQSPPPEVVFRPPPPAAPPRPPVVPRAARPARSESSSGSGIWWFLALLVGLPILFNHLPHTSSTLSTPQSRPVEVRPALPPWSSVKFYDGTIVPVCYQGQLPNSAALPSQGRFIGEEWAIGNHSWIWMQPAGASFPSWVDP